MAEATGRFRRSDRLLDSRDFRRVMRRGRRRAHADLVVILAPRRESNRDSVRLRDSHGDAVDRADVRPGSRIGITASRKVGGAVLRNRFKRRLREWFRRRRGDLGQTVDMVVIARPGAAQLSMTQLDQRLSGLLKIERSSAWPRADVARSR